MPSFSEDLGLVFDDIRHGELNRLTSTSNSALAEKWVGNRGESDGAAGGRMLLEYICPEGGGQEND